jgi:hypothetical protein
MTRMKIAHWTMFNNSGMYHMAETMARAEAMSGLDSWLVNFQDPAGYKEILDADIQVIHTHLPDDVRLQLTKPLKTVWVAHGTPEYVFQRSVEAGLNRGYGASDSWALAQYWMQNSDAIVTFWDRQQAIWQSLCDKRTVVDLVPQGIDKSFWTPTESLGKYMGTPSLFTAENADYSKWPLDLFIAWPWVWKEIPTAFLHSVYLPTDQHRWWYPLLNRNGAGFKTISAGIILSPEQLRNAFCSTDYYIGLARYGTCNLTCAQANASGAKTISFAGNEYTDYWVTEGDQRVIAKELLAILKGEVAPRHKTPIADIAETVKAMTAIYERIL